MTQSAESEFKVQSSGFNVQGSPFADRLLPLSDGRPGLRGTMHVEVRQPSSDPSTPDTRPSSTLDFISSDETLDRYGEIIQASGWKLSSYHRNPVFQNAHQYGDVIFTLGRALVTELDSLVEFVGWVPNSLDRRPPILHH